MYSPRIKKELITQLYQIGKQSNRPMTELINEMLREGIRRWYRKKERKGEDEDRAINRSPDPEGSPRV